MNNTYHSPQTQIDELIEIVTNTNRELLQRSPLQRISYFLYKTKLRLEKLKAESMPYHYHPDAKKLIEHAMVALEDEFGEHASQPLRAELLNVFHEIRDLERGIPAGASVAELAGGAD